MSVNAHCNTLPHQPVSFVFTLSLHKLLRYYTHCLLLQQSIGLRFYFHRVSEQAMGPSAGVNNAFHASWFSGKLYFIGAELRFDRIVPGRSLELCLPVVWRLWWEQPPSLSRGRRDTDGSLRLNSPREKLQADIASFLSQTLNALL